jgi:hypothetical protein
MTETFAPARASFRGMGPFGIWKLEYWRFVWNLEFGAWDFRASRLTSGAAPGVLTQKETCE